MRSDPQHHGRVLAFPTAYLDRQHGRVRGVTLVHAETRSLFNVSTILTQKTTFIPLATPRTF
jgi:hypothetical protein